MANYAVTFQAVRTLPWHWCRQPLTVALGATTTSGGGVRTRTCNGLRQPAPTITLLLRPIAGQLCGEGSGRRVYQFHHPAKNNFRRPRARASPSAQPSKRSRSAKYHAAAIAIILMPQGNAGAGNAAILLLNGTAESVKKRGKVSCGQVASAAKISGDGDAAVSLTIASTNQSHQWCLRDRVNGADDGIRTRDPTLKRR